MQEKIVARKKGHEARHIALGDDTYRGWTVITLATLTSRPNPPRTHAKSSGRTIRLQRTQLTTPMTRGAPYPSWHKSLEGLEEAWCHTPKRHTNRSPGSPRARRRRGNCPDVEIGGILPKHISFPSELMAFLNNHNISFKLFRSYCKFLTCSIEGSRPLALWYVEFWWLMPTGCAGITIFMSWCVRLSSGIKIRVDSSLVEEQ